MGNSSNDYGKSIKMLTIGISIFMCFTLSLLFFGWIDNLFFGHELSAYLSNTYFRGMIGFIMIPIFGGGAYMVYWATRSNTSFMDAYYEKLDLPTNAETEYAGSLIERKVKDFAKSDEAFGQLLKRFYGYMRSVSGSGQFGVRQALDLNADSVNYLLYFYVMAFFILPFLIALVFTISYVEWVYGADFYEVMKQARTLRPDLVLAVVGILMVLLIRVIFRTVRFVVEKFLGSFLNAGEKALSTEKMDPWNSNFKAFMTEKHQQTKVPAAAYFYPLLMLSAMLPLSIGAVLLNNVLMIAGGGCLLIGVLLRRFAGGKGIWFQFQNDKTLKIGKGLSSTELKIEEVEEAIVHYQSIKDNSIRLSSETAMIRSLISREILNELMDSPELIPSTITFFMRNGNGYDVPLRFMTRNGKEVYSHELEFFFAFWLKSHGFSFELEKTDEDAGDWRAFK